HSILLPSRHPKPSLSNPLQSLPLPQTQSSCGVCMPKTPFHPDARWHIFLPLLHLLVAVLPTKLLLFNNRPILRRPNLHPLPIPIHAPTSLTPIPSPTPTHADQRVQRPRHESRAP